MPHVKGSGPFQMPTAKGRGLQAPVFFSAWLTTNLGVPMTPLSFDNLLGQLTEVRKGLIEYIKDINEEPDERYIGWGTLQRGS